MKKITAVLLCISIVFSLAACGKTQTLTKTTAEPAQTGLHVQKNLLTVDVTFPASFFSDEEPATNELTEQQKKQGISKAVVNADGSVTYTILRIRYGKFVKETRQTTIDSINDILQEGGNAFTKIDYNSDLSEITIHVDKDQFNNGLSDALSIYAIYLSVAVYRKLAGKEPTCKIDVVDNRTNELISSQVYPTEGDGNAVPKETQTEKTAEKQAEVSVTKAVKRTDGEGKPYALLTVEFTNLSAETASFSDLCTVSVFQNGIECKESFLWDDVDTSSKHTKILPTVTYTVTLAYLLQDPVHDTQVEVKSCSAFEKPITYAQTVVHWK